MAVGDKPSPFDFVSDISFGKQNNLIEAHEAAYNPFLTNRAFSYHLDSLFEANDMNMWPQLAHRLQNSYLLNILVRRKRFAKWAKRVKREEDLLLLCEVLEINMKRANEVFDLLTDDDIEKLKETRDVGGVK